MINFYSYFVQLIFKSVIFISQLFVGLLISFEVAIFCSMTAAVIHANFTSRC